MLGIIGGSGVYDLAELEILERREMMTPFGVPSDGIVLGRLAGTDIAFVSRHGVGHRIGPSEVPYRANIYALKQIGVTHLLTVSAVGSLREELAPLSIVLPDQVIDRTIGRARSFFENGAVAHVGLAEPYCATFRSSVHLAAASMGIQIANGGTYVCIEGPQFSTRAESHLFRNWGASVIGMTAMPEARLAREAELCYATLAMVTDYDVWHETEAAVSVEMVIGNLSKNAEAAREIILAVAKTGLPFQSCGCPHALQHAIVTDPATVTAETRERLGLIAERYLSEPLNT